MKTRIFLLPLLLITLVAFKKADLPKPVDKEFAFVPSGFAVVDQDTLSVQSFFIQIHEVTNAQYRTFLEEAKSELEQKQWAAAQVDEDAWSKVMSSDGSMSKMYFTHAAFENYPVVNITYEGALLYCQWLEKKINEKMPLEGKVEVRLPEKAEFIRAGAVDHLNRSYTWGGQFMRNTEGKFLCNFARIPQSAITQNDKGEPIKVSTQTKDYSGDEYFLTAKVPSYYPNELGIYNLNGNVAEMLAEKGRAAGGSWNSYGYDVRLQSVMQFDGPSPQVGFRPVFTYVKN